MVMFQILFTDLYIDWEKKSWSEVAAVLGLIYMFARHKYFHGYAESAKGRLPGFYLNLVVVMVLIALGTTGIVNSFLDEYLDFNIGNKLRKLI
uniref:Uncharacterized protein n=1 Tax=Sphaerodactylus townsendi TaxID=933632 RepID=A0ACB8E7N4_9SAUR